MARLQAPNTGAPGFDLGRELDPTCMTKSLHVTAKDPTAPQLRPGSQINRYYFKNQNDITIKIIFTKVWRVGKKLIQVLESCLTRAGPTYRIQ